MSGTGRNLKITLVALGLAHMVAALVYKYDAFAGITGMLYADGQPVGGDFINLWTAARMVLTGHAGEVYSVEAFKAYQATLTGGADMGLRLWAYPPHSLLFAWPLGLFGYHAALAGWSVFGIGMLLIGARRFGFDRLETAVLLVSPATVLNLYYGQTGSVATGLMLLALSARTSRDAVPAGAAAILTIKPQAGFLLPVLWLFERRWRMILTTGAVAVILAVLSVALFGLAPWRDYLGDTLPALSALERHGTGPFLTMIPSVFIAMRLVSGDSAMALAVHAAFAAAGGLVLLWRLWRVRDPERRAAMVLVATVLMTPYMHNYDLGLLLCGALIVARRPWVADSGPLRAELFVLIAWMLPQLVVLFSILGAPISPLLILPLLFLA
jgi:hypothetical protein